MAPGIRKPETATYIYTAEYVRKEHGFSFAETNFLLFFSFILSRVITCHCNESFHSAMWLECESGTAVSWRKAVCLVLAARVGIGEIRRQ